jgi:hypothetical protein
MTMSEFSNRISAQRSILKLINGSGLYIEPLLGLAEKAIDRWHRNNGVDAHDLVVIMLKSMSGTLFFLANKSQEQVTNEYTLLSEKVKEQLFELELEIIKRKA